MNVWKRMKKEILRNLWVQQTLKLMTPNCLKFLMLIENSQNDFRNTSRNQMKMFANVSNLNHEIFKMSIKKRKFQPENQTFFLSSGNTQRFPPTKNGGDAESSKIFNPINDLNDQTSYFINYFVRSRMNFVVELRNFQDWIVYSFKERLDVNFLFSMINDLSIGTKYLAAKTDLFKIQCFLFKKC